MEEYSETSLLKYFYKNLLLETKKSIRNSLSKNRIALGLILIGLASLISMILLLSLWKSGGVAREIFSYIFDKATTVTLWEAMCILLVENKEKRDYRTNLLHKFNSISFHKYI